MYTHVGWKLTHNMTVIRITLIKHCPKLVTHSLRGPRVHSRKVTQSLHHLASLGLFHLDVLVAGSGHVAALDQSQPRGKGAMIGRPNHLTSSTAPTRRLY